MHTELPQRPGLLRVAVASFVVAGGVVFLAPTFDFDSDDDGVADVIEVYERGSDPASADVDYNSTVATRIPEASER